tara:strand:+ start:173 stop:343 length:171 start_codon:yes stop_codon:yes gene_type:complete
MTLENGLDEKKLDRAKFFRQYINRIKRKKLAQKRDNTLRTIKKLAAQSGVDLRKVM